MQYNSNIFVLGNSHAVRLPKRLLEVLSFKDNEAVTISKLDNYTIIIKKATPAVHRTIQDRFKGYKGNVTVSEWDTGAPVGKEIL